MKTHEKILKALSFALSQLVLATTWLIVQNGLTSLVQRVTGSDAWAFCLGTLLFFVCLAVYFSATTFVVRRLYGVGAEVSPRTWLGMLPGLSHLAPTEDSPSRPGSNDAHIIISGSPGAGKTTMLPSMLRWFNLSDLYAEATRAFTEDLSVSLQKWIHQAATEADRASQDWQLALDDLVQASAEDDTIKAAKLRDRILEGMTEMDRALQLWRSLMEDSISASTEDVQTQTTELWDRILEGMAEMDRASQEWRLALDDLVQASAEDDPIEAAKLRMRAKDVLPRLSER